MVENNPNYLGAVVPPKNGLCGKPVMQQQYINIFGRMGKDLNVKPQFIMTTAVQESGWNLVHVYGTNKLSNGQPLNNLFGAAPGGGNNKPYPSVWASAQDWENSWGPQLTNNPQTIHDYVKDLLSVPTHMYNTNPSYPANMAATYNTVTRAINTCGTTF